MIYLYVETSCWWQAYINKTKQTFGTHKVNMSNATWSHKKGKKQEQWEWLILVVCYGGVEIEISWIRVWIMMMMVMVIVMMNRHAQLSLHSSFLKQQREYIWLYLMHALLIFHSQIQHFICTHFPTLRIYPNFR
jgi:hypothetical protein